MPRIQLSPEEERKRIRKARIEDMQESIKREKVFDSAKPVSEKDLARFGDISDVAEAKIS